jgi:uncharacterized protein YbaR (Trm112 family)
MKRPVILKPKMGHPFECPHCKTKLYLKEEEGYYSLPNKRGDWKKTYWILEEVTPELLKQLENEGFDVSLARL